MLISKAVFYNSAKGRPGGWFDAQTQEKPISGEKRRSDWTLPSSVFQSAWLDVMVTLSSFTHTGKCSLDMIKLVRLQSPAFKWSLSVFCFECLSTYFTCVQAPFDQTQCAFEVFLWWHLYNMYLSLSCVLSWCDVPCALCHYICVDRCCNQTFPLMMYQYVII